MIISLKQAIEHHTISIGPWSILLVILQQAKEGLLEGRGLILSSALCPAGGILEEAKVLIFDTVVGIVLSDPRCCRGNCALEEQASQNVQCASGALLAAMLLVLNVA